MGGDTNVGGDGGNNGGDDGDDDEDEMVGSNKNVYRDNVNVGDGKNKVDLGDVHSGGDDSNVDGGVDDVGWVITNDSDDASCGNDDSKFHGGDDTDRSDCDDKDDRMLMIVVMLTLILVTNDANCGDGESKVDCIEEIAGDDSNGNAEGDPNDDGRGDNNDASRGGDDGDSESNDVTDRHKHDDADDDGGCLNFAKKNCFKIKQIDLGNFSLPVFTR